jgi:pSer/pThr/pTyr-binding forkhead associated (FHA) protein
VFCHNCGHRNPEGVNFCSSCGHALLADGDDATITLHPTDDPDTGEVRPDVELVAVPHGSGVLVVTRGPNIGARYLLGDKVVRAGRHPESDIFLDDITVSRRHSVIERSGDDFRIRDVGSLNGTYVNHDRVDHKPIHDADEIQVGRFVLIFRVGGA